MTRDKAVLTVRASSSATLEFAYHNIPSTYLLNRPGASRTLPNLQQHNIPTWEVSMRLWHHVMDRRLAPMFSNTSSSIPLFFFLLWTMRVITRCRPRIWAGCSAHMNSIRLPNRRPYTAPCLSPCNPPRYLKSDSSLLLVCGKMWKCKTGFSVRLGSTG